MKQLDSFDVPGLQAAWDRLSETSSSASLFTSYAWCRCWAETVGQDADPVILQVVNRQSETVGILPLCVHRGHRLRWLKFMGRDRVSGDHLDVLCSPEDAGACLAAILDHLDQPGRDYHGLVLGELDPASPTVAAFKTWADRHRYPHREREHRVVPFIDLPASLDAYLASRSKKRRGHVRRQRKALTRIPGAAIRLDREPGTVDRVLDRFFHLHEERWRADGQTSNYQDPSLRDFLRRFCRVMARQDRLRCYSLDIADEPQAVLIAFHWRDTAYFYQIGRRCDSPIESPGQLLIAESIEQAIREGLARYDFLRGDEPYKFFWTSQSTEQTTLVIGCGLSARLALATEGLKNRAKAAVERSLGGDAWARAKAIIRR